jgi:Fe-S cluster assembly protein SufD
MMVTTSPSIWSSFEAFKGRTHKGSAYIDRIYEEAREALEELPTPTRKTEAWKYTPLTGISKTAWSTAKEASMFNVEELDLPAIDAYMVWVIDGEVILEESELPEGVQLLTMSEAKDLETDRFESVFGQLADHKNDMMVALNTTFANGGIYLHVAKRAILDKPIHLVHVYSQTNTAVFNRHMVVMDEGTEAHVLCSTFHADGSIFSNMVTEVLLADNAKLTLDRLQRGTAESSHFSTEEVHQGRDAVFTQNTITLSGGWTRNEPHVRFKGENGLCHLNGAYMPHGKDLVDNHSIIDHLVPRCESHELYKGVIYDQAKGVFNGKVFVRPDAQKTNAYQQNANILMTENGSMNSKPELEIYADDVKCSHGSTTGQLDQEALFYLQCRGLSHAKAKQMLVNAFVGEVIERLSSHELREWVWSRFEEKLSV